MAQVKAAFAMTCVLSAVGLLAIVINSLIVVRWGRRRVLIINGLIWCGILQLIIAIVYDKMPGQVVAGRVTVALSSLYMFSYNVSRRILTNYLLALGKTID